MSKSKLITKDISKIYGTKVILKKFNFRVGQGEVVALLGPNGAGKTTAFYAIVGIIPVTSGTIFLNDIDITFCPLYIRSKLGIGYLPQEASIFRKLSVEDNLKIALEAKYKNDKQKIKRRIDQLLDEFNIGHIRDSIGAVLSGGERRRVEVARILAIDPTFLLLDEPFAGVDPVAVNDIKDIILLLKKKNIGVVITDHNVKETLEISDKAYVLYNGEIICSGSANEIKKNKMVRQVYLGDNFSAK